MCWAVLISYFIHLDLSCLYNSHATSRYTSTIWIDFIICLQLLFSTVVSPTLISVSFICTQELVKLPPTSCRFCGCPMGSTFWGFMFSTGTLHAPSWVRLILDGSEGPRLYVCRWNWLAVATAELHFHICPAPFMFVASISALYGWKHLKYTALFRVSGIYVYTVNFWTAT